MRLSQRLSKPTVLASTQNLRRLFEGRVYHRVKKHTKSATSSWNGGQIYYDTYLLASCGEDWSEHYWNRIDARRLFTMNPCTRCFPNGVEIQVEPPWRPYQMVIVGLRSKSKHIKMGGHTLCGKDVARTSENLAVHIEGLPVCRNCMIVDQSQVRNAWKGLVRAA